MQKQESKKGALKWIILAVALVAVAAAVVLALSFMGGEETPAETQPATEQVQVDDTIKIYWNVDRKEYAAKGLNGASSRIPRSDGYYYIRFAVDGEQIDLPVADRTLVDQLDTFNYVGLVLDENGVVIGYKDVYEFTGGLAADGYFVEDINGTTYTVNTSGNYRGVSVDVEIPETAKIYNVGGTGLLVGIPGQIARDDEIIAIQDENGEVFLVFVLPYEMPGDLYWNMVRMYDSVTGMTTRETSVTGWYEFEMAFGGGIVTLRTRDMNVANAIDKNAAKCNGMIFDEDGNISGITSAGAATGGSAVGSWHHIIAINGDEITMEKFSGSDKGNVYTGVLSEHTKIVNVSSVGTPGAYLKPEELRVGDQVHCLTDARTKLAYVFVISRLSDTAKLCWNVERQYNSTTKQTTRVPAADGYYYILLTSEGEQFTARTKDKNLINTIDQNAAKCVAVELDGDEIIKVSGTSTVTGGAAVASWYDIFEISADGTQVKARKNQKGHAEDGNVVEITITENTNIYNVSGDVKTKRSTIGQRTTLMVGDKIHCLTNLSKQIHSVFVVSRPNHYPVGWNMVRKYNTTTKQTTRQRAEDGYFYFDIALNGEVRTLKTASLDVANHIDANAAKCRGLLVYGDVIIESVATSAVYGTNGSVEASWAYVTHVNGNYARAVKRDGTQAGEVYDIYMSWNCKVYNVSDMYDDHPGEKTKVRVGDLVHCLRDIDKNTTYVFVINRSVDGIPAWNVERMYDSATKGTSRTPDAEGWYNITFVVDGEQKTYKTQDKAIADAVDAISNKMCGLKLEGDVIVQVAAAEKLIACAGGVKTGCAAKSADETGITVMDPATGKDIRYTYVKGTGAYNVTDHVESFVGEPANIEYGASVNILLDANGRALAVYMTTRGVSEVTTGYCNICKKEVKWVKHEAGRPILAGVHTWLDSDVTMDAAVNTAGGTYTLFLNGHTLTFNDRAFRLNNNTVLNIYDSKEDGSDIGGKLVGKGIDQATADAENSGRSEGGVIMIWGSNTLNLYSGTLAYETGSKAVNNGGVVSGNGVFNMYGGTVTGGVATGSGAQVRMFNGVFNMYDGTVDEGTVGGNGTSVVSDGNDSTKCGVNLLGGTIKGNVYATTVGSISVGGDVKINEIVLIAGKRFAIAKPLTEGASIGINMATPGVFLENTQDMTGIFSSKLYGVVYDEQAKTHALKADHNHCACGGEFEHTHTEIGWAKWDGTTVIKSGSYYLTQDVQLDTWLNVSGTLNICLNGHTLESAGRVFKLSGGATLNITDCGEDGKIIGHGISQAEADAEQKGTSEGGVIMIWGSNTLNLYKGTLIYEKGEKDVLNGAVVAGNGVFNMYGGTIRGGQAKGYGGNVRIFNGTFNMYDGTIISGTCANGSAVSVGGARGVCNLMGGTMTNVYIENNAAVTMGGDLTVADLFLQKGQTITFTDTLAGTSSVGITMADPGVFANDVQEDISDRFLAAFPVEYDPDAKTLAVKVPEHAHCVCAGHAQGAGDHTTCEDINWSAWTSATSLPTESGNYYLTCDVELETMVLIQNSKDVKLCLNGFTVTSNERVYKVYQGGTVTASILTITDCVGTGVMEGRGLPEEKKEQTNNEAAVLMGWGSNTIHIYGGTLRMRDDHYTMANGGLISANGILNIYGGTLTGGTAKSAGGNIRLFNAKLNVYGGVIENGSCSLKGANISVGGANSAIKLLGGTISAADPAFTGGAIHCDSASIPVYVGGNAQVADVYVRKDQTLLLEGTLTGTVGVRMEEPGVFMQNVESDLSGRFTSNMDDYQVSYDENAKTMALVANVVDQPHTAHCICGGNAVKVGDHTSCSDLTWTAWTSGTSLPTSAGNYYLTKDVTLQTMVTLNGSTMGGNKTLNLCLNSYSVVSESRVFIQKNSSILNITDCTNSGEVVGKGLSDAEITAEGNGGVCEGGVIMQWNSNTTTRLYGGTLRFASEAEGGRNNVRNSGIFQGAGTFCMYAGTVKDGRVTGSGGNLRMHSGKMFLYGGLVENGSAKSGGNVAVNQKNVAQIGAVTLKNGSALIVENSSNGGNLFVEGTGSATVDGTIFIGGRACRGGNVAVFGNATIKNCTISGGFGENDGGNLFTYDKGVLTLENVTLGAVAQGGTVTSFAVNGTSLTLKGKVCMTGAGKNLRIASGKSVVATELTEGSLIGVTLNEATDKIATVSGYTDMQYFYSDSASYSVAYNNDNTLSLVSGHVHCLCVGGYDGTGHSHTNTQTWQAWDGTSALESGKYYYLTKDVSRTAKLIINKGEQINLCLNGYKLSSTTRALEIKGELNLTDCKHSGMVTSGSSALAPVFYVFANGVFNLYGGTLQADKNVAQAGVGAVSHDGAAGDPVGIMNMYGGTIIGNKVTNGGGTISMWNLSVLNIYGGKITGGEAGGVAGNINVGAGCTLNIYGGTVEKGVSTGSNGGNIYVGGSADGNTPGKLNIYGGTISGGKGKEGGNIALFRAHGVISGGLICDGESTTGAGGNIYLGGQDKTDTQPRVASVLTVNGSAVIKNGTSKAKGGNIYVQWLCQLTLGGDAYITGGKAGTLGGGILCYSMKPNISGRVRIEGNVGSDLYLDGASATNYAKLGTCALETGAHIGITMTYPQVFAPTEASGQEEFFFPNDEANYQIVWDNNQLILQEKQ